LSQPLKVYVKLSKEKSSLDSQLLKLQAFDRDPWTRNKFVSAYAVLPPEAICGLSAGSPWKDAYGLVQEYGHCDLGKYIRSLQEQRGVGVDPMVILPETKQLVDIVLAAHKSGWALLDIKESNFVRVHNESIGIYTLKAIDVETAVHVGSDHEIPQQVFGTPTYVSPELARWLLKTEPIRTNVDLMLADIWAVGVTVWKMFEAQGRSMWESELFNLGGNSDGILRRLTTITNQEVERCFNMTFRGGNIKLRSLLMKVYTNILFIYSFICI